MASETARLYVRGLISNLGGLTVLLALAYRLNLIFYAVVALGVQYAVFLTHGLPNRSEKFYDLSGSCTHLAVVVASLVREQKVRSIRQVFTAVAATVWMTRLGTFLYSRILRDGKDGRFDDIRKVWLSFMGAWTVQAVWVTFTELPVLLINDRDDNVPLTLLDYLAMLSWLAGFLLEATADSQKLAFRDDPANKGRFITTGVWRYSRHPNYCGEIMMWCSQAALVSFAAWGHPDWSSLLCSWISPAFTALLLLKVTGVPMVEKAGMQKWGQEPEYLHYMANTNCLIPGPPAQPLSDSSKNK